MPPDRQLRDRLETAAWIAIGAAIILIYTLLGLFILTS